MSKSVRIPDRSYEQADELRGMGYESLTNVMAVAIDRLYEAEGPKGAGMRIAEHKSGNGTVVMKEADRGYIVTVNREGLPPHYSQEHATYQEAAVEFERLAGKQAGPVQIRVTYTAEDLDTNGFLTDDHIADYADNLKTYLATEFPDAEIEVTLGDDDRIRVYGLGYRATMSTQAEVHYAMEDHYQRWADEIAAQL